MTVVTVDVGRAHPPTARVETTSMTRILPAVIIVSASARTVTVIDVMTAVGIAGGIAGTTATAATAAAIHDEIEIFSTSEVAEAAVEGIVRALEEADENAEIEARHLPHGRRSQHLTSRT